MAYETWNWTLDESGGGSGLPQRFLPKRVSPLLKQETEAGYIVTRPKYTKDHWIFQVGWDTMHPAGYVYLANFFYARRGGDLFYFTWPVALYGLPSELYTADPGGISLWASEVEPAYGVSPTWLVRFNQDELNAERVQGVENNYWRVEMELRTT